jgi:hypothetical protein
VCPFEFAARTRPGHAVACSRCTRPARQQEQRQVVLDGGDGVHGTLLPSWQPVSAPCSASELILQRFRRCGCCVRMPADAAAVIVLNVLVSFEDRVPNQSKQGLEQQAGLVVFACPTSWLLSLEPALHGTILGRPSPDRRHLTLRARVDDPASP